MFQNRNCPKTSDETVCLEFQQNLWKSLQRACGRLVNVLHKLGYILDLHGCKLEISKKVWRKSLIWSLYKVCVVLQWMQCTDVLIITSVYHNFTMDQCDGNSKLPICSSSPLTKIYRYPVDSLGSDSFSQTDRQTDKQADRQDLHIKHFYGFIGVYVQHYFSH